MNGIIYVAGGGGGGSGTTLEAYDPATDTWTSKAPMPTARQYAAAGVANGILYVFGGDWTAGILATVEAYDPATDTWTPKAPMPTPRTGLAVAVVNGILYAVGGAGATSSLDTVEAYDPASGTWATAPSMPTPRFLFGAGSVGGVLYAVGGGETGVGSLAVNEAFTPLVPFAAFAAKAEIAFGPLANDDAFEVKATFSLGAGSDGIAPLTEDVSLQVGTFSTTIPAGSFTFVPAKPRKPAHFKFEGVIGGVSLQAKIIPLGADSFEFKAGGQGADLTGTVNPVTVGLTIGDDGGSTMVTAEIL